MKNSKLFEFSFVLLVGLLISTVGTAQHKIQGTVTDEKGTPLVGVTVNVKGTKLGTATDGKGDFTLIVSDNAKLEVSHIDFQTQEIIVGSKANFTIQMEASSISLDQVVIVGYGTQKKVNLTGAISQINSEEINKRPVNNLTQALQGLAPNLNIAATADGGAADATMSLNIRGIGSLSSSEPYILIDGVRATQTEFSALNPRDVQSISVLKDAAASAIYGAQAAYGVILVETKKGKKSQGFSISLSSDLRLIKQIFVPKTVSSLEWAKVANVASQNFSGQVMFNQDQLAKIQSFIEGKAGKYGTAPDPNNPNQWLGIGDGSSNSWTSGFANTDWFDVMYKDVGFTKKHNISVQGGSNNVTYYISGGFLQDPGMFTYGSKNENFKRFNLNSNVSADVTNWLTISNVTRFYQENNIFPATLEGGSRGRVFHDIMRFSPLLPIKTPPIKDNQGNIIVPEQLADIAGWNENNGFDEYQIEDYVSTFKAEIKITKGLSLKGDFTFKKNHYEGTLNFKKWTLFGPDDQPSLVYQANNNQIGKNLNSTNYTSFNIYANYNKSFSDKHNFQVLAGFQKEENKYSELDVSRTDVIANNLSSLNLAVGQLTGPNNPISDWATMGAFGRLSYNFKEKYLLEFNGRYDGSSKFAPDNRFGFFPSLSLGYNIYKEKFWSSLRNIINTMKIRVSYGKLGNQDVASNLYLSSIPINTQLGWEIGGERPLYTGIPAITSPNITWETSKTKNLGLDLTFLNNQLSTSLDIYDRQTENMFGPVSALPAVLGTAPPQTNSASLSTKGWGLVIGWDHRSKDVGYNVKLMLSNNNSYITQYNNPNKVLSDWYVGEKIDEIWGFKADKLFQSKDEVEKYTSTVDLSYLGTGWQPGDVKYEDLNGDGKVNVGANTRSNPGDQIIIGNSNPQYSVSIQAGVSWKDFDFAMLWQGIGKRDIMLDTYASLFWGWNGEPHTHLTKASLDYWSKDNPEGYLPVPLSSGGRSGFGKDRNPSTRYLQNGAYIRLKSLNIGYTLPSQLIKKLKIKYIRIYVSGENLITLTEMWSTLDPELATVGGISRTSDGRAYPLSQAFTFGFSVTL